MKSRGCSVAILACAAMLGGAPLEGATLESVRVTVLMGVDRTCDVTAAFGLTSESPATVVHRVLLGHPGDTIGVAVAGASAGPPRAAGRTWEVPVTVGAGLNRFEARYRVPMIDQGRCGLLVPDAPTDGVSRRVEVEVRLAPDARRLPGEFPALAWDGNAGRVTLGHLPAFVVAPHAAAGGDGPVGVAATERTMTGFGWNFYGFFLAAAAWLTCYFLWAWRADVRERKAPR